MNDPFGFDHFCLHTFLKQTPVINVFRPRVFIQVVNNTLNPVWNQTFEFVVEDGLHELLILEVYDHDLFGKVCITAK